MTASRLALFLLLVSTSASAQTFLFSGHLDDGDQPANGSFTVGLAIKDGDTVLWDEEQPSVVVVDGNFAIDVGAVEPLDVAPPATARLVVTIDGDELPPAPLGRLAVAFNVGVAAEVSNASDADVVGDVTIDEALRVGDLASGGVAYPFAAITGVPADLADGDNGQDLTLAANSGLTLQSRTLSLGTTILGSKLAPGSISNINAVADVYSATKIVDGAVTGNKVADGTLTQTALSNFVTEAQTAVIPVFQVTATNCTFPPGTMLTTSTCPNIRTGCSNFQVQACASTSCIISTLPEAICTNTKLGNLVAQ